VAPSAGEEVVLRVAKDDKTIVEEEAGADAALATAGNEAESTAAEAVDAMVEKQVDQTSLVIPCKQDQRFVIGCRMKLAHFVLHSVKV
jgi:hypothetical protein